MSAPESEPQPPPMSAPASESAPVSEPEPPPASVVAEPVSASQAPRAAAAPPDDGSPSPTTDRVALGRSVQERAALRRRLRARGAPLERPSAPAERAGPKPEVETTREEAHVATSDFPVADAHATDSAEHVDDAAPDAIDPAPSGDRVHGPPASRPARRFLGAMSARSEAAPGTKPSRRIALTLAVAAVALTVVLTLMPLYLLSLARAHASQCFEGIVASGNGDPIGCLPPRYQLAPAQRLPWFQHDARQLAADTRYRAALLAYGKATAIHPDPAARKQAAQILLDASTSVDADTGVSPLYELWGAFTEVAELGVGSNDRVLRAHAFDSARAVAALDALRTLAVGFDASEHFALNLRRGALSCLMGDADDGARALAAAEQGYRQASKSGEGFELARLALLACNRPSHAGGNAERIQPRLYPAMVAMEAARGNADALDRVRSLLEDRERHLIGEHRLRLAAYAIADAKPVAAQALAWLAPRRGPAAKLDVDELRTPWTMFDVTTPTGGVLVHPSITEQAAAHLEGVLQGLSDGPLPCVGDECPVDVALTMPVPILREATRMMWLDSAAERARRGDRDGSLTALGHADALTPDRRKHQGAAVRLAVGDARGALDACDTALASVGGSGRARSRILLDKALALAHLGKTPAAYRAAEDAFTAALATDESSEDDASVTKELLLQDRLTAAWMWGAMSLAADEGGKVITLLQGSAIDDLALLSVWLGHARRPEAERLKERWNLSMRDPPMAVLPAAMFIVGRIVPADADTEVWLDRVFHDVHRRQPMLSMLARAEAARWRGDASAERVWRQRAESIHALTTDYPTAVLAQLAELR